MTDAEREELAVLRSLMPRLDRAGQGDKDQQARAWSMVYKELVAVGLNSFLDDLNDVGAVRAVKFIRHLAAGRATKGT